jgi:hypothetical protein
MKFVKNWIYCEVIWHILGRFLVSKEKVVKERGIKNFRRGEDFDILGEKNNK